jgi:hypothetical protein
VKIGFGTGKFTPLKNNLKKTELSLAQTDSSRNNPAKIIPVQTANDQQVIMPSILPVERVDSCVY